MDTRTILQVSAVITACTCLYLTVIHLSMPRLRGLRSVCFGLASASFGMALSSLNGQIPDAYSFTLANAFLILINVFLFSGLRDLIQSRSRLLLWLVALSALPEFAGQLYFLFIVPSVPIRIAIYSAVVALQDIALIYLVLRDGLPEMRRPRYSLGILFALSAALNILRIYLGFTQKSPSLFPRASAINGVMVLIPVVTAVLTGIGLLWLSMSRTQHELELQSRTDALTGLLNRRAIERSSTREILRARRMNSPFSAILLDLDRFKSINDRYGHQAGDVALSLTAQKLTSELRATDLIARFGGEEFVIFLPDTALSDAEDIAERLRLGLTRLIVRHRRQEFPLSASFGVTQLAPDDVNWEDMIRRADQALYAAKHQGRNCIVVR